MASAHLDIIGVHTSFLDDAEVMTAIYLSLPAAGNVVLLSTDTFDDIDLTDVSLLDRAYLGLRWRRFMVDDDVNTRILHVVAAGNTGAEPDDISWGGTFTANANLTLGADPDDEFAWRAGGQNEVELNLDFEVTEAVSFVFTGSYTLRIVLQGGYDLLDQEGRGSQVLSYDFTLSFD